MVEAQPARDHVQGRVDGLLGALEPVLGLRRGDGMQVVELRLPPHDGVDVAEQPVEPELEARRFPSAEDPLHLVAGVGPRRADAGQGEVAARQLRAAAVHLVEDVHDDLDGLVGSGHLLDVEVHLSDGVNLVQAVDVVPEGRGIDPQDAQPRQEGADSALEQRRHVHPQWIIPHRERRVEHEVLLAEVEVQTSEGVLVAVEELRRLAPDEAVERGHALLPRRATASRCPAPARLHPGRRRRRPWSPTRGARRSGAAGRGSPSGPAPGRGSRRTRAGTRGAPCGRCRCGRGLSRPSRGCLQLAGGCRSVQTTYKEVRRGTNFEDRAAGGARA